MCLLVLPWWQFIFIDTQVVEIVYRYDQDCIPEMYRGNVTAYIQDPLINKTCIKNVTVSLLTVMYFDF